MLINSHSRGNFWNDHWTDWGREGAASRVWTCYQLERSPQRLVTPHGRLAYPVPCPQKQGTVLPCFFFIQRMKIQKFLHSRNYVVCPLVEYYNNTRGTPVVASLWTDALTMHLAVYRNNLLKSKCISGLSGFCLGFMCHRTTSGSVLKNINITFQRCYG